ncbi:MAG: hypothetical protein A4E28_03261 [Methanocella sp. PtaU1.Bin125]|nr:MAG: hypothetical protein A4E28_03261 [Methanocella sp. PtaU1.Bin125]
MVVISMKSKDIVIVGVLLGIGAIVRLVSLVIPGAITSNLVIAFYALAIALILPTLTEAIGIGLVAGIICALISHSVFPPANLNSEPVGAIVALLVIKGALIPNVLRKYKAGVTALVATLASGFTFAAVAAFVIVALPEFLNKAAPSLAKGAPPVDVFILGLLPIVIGCAIVNFFIAQVLYIPAKKAMR